MADAPQQPPAEGGAAAAAETKPDVKKEQINIRVVGQDQAEMYFKIKRSTQFRKLMDAYCEKMGKQPGSVRFTFDGERIGENQTPADLNMEDNDTIEVFIMQVGGARA